ncbi:hypothetical protein [Enterococcus faecalis]
MNHFKGKQFQQDVIIVAVDYIRKPEKKALSSGFRSVLKSRYYWESQLKS